ncbi:MAG: hypothetical protein ABSA63_08680 [Thermoplasmata archaeon]
MAAVPEAAPLKPGHQVRTVVIVVVIVVAAVLAGLLVAGVGPFAPASSCGSPSYPVTFAENGLPHGTGWEVSLGNSLRESTGSIVFCEKGGTYPFEVWPPSACVPSPRDGNAVVNGVAVFVTIAFTCTKELNFTWGLASNVTGTTPTGCESKTLYCYTIGIAIVGRGLNASNLQLRLLAPLGGNPNWSTDAISLVGPGETLLATYNTTSSSWTLQDTFNGTVSAGLSLVIQPAAATQVDGLAGDVLIAIGVNGFAGTVDSGTIP